MSYRATHQVDVDVVCEPGEIVPSRVEGVYQITGKLRKELMDAGLFARVLDMGGNVPHLRLFGPKGKIQAYLTKNEYADVRITTRPVRN